ncbi:MAG: PH domain-containing protein [Balneolaceae bacterium]
MSEFRRQHPIAAVTQFLGVLRQNIVPIVIFLVVGSRNTDEYFWYFFVLGIASTLVLGIFGWLRFTYRVDGDELQIKKGVFVRKKLYLTRDRIQVIDITEGILQRIFGLVKVEVKSAGSGTEGATISAITREEALELRTLLRGESFPKKEEIEEYSKEEIKEVLTWKLSGRDLFLAALTSGNFGLIASILGAISGQLDQFVTEENLNYILDYIPGLGNASIFVGIFVIIFVVSYIFSFIGVIFQYADFKVEKMENELHITSGLLERKHTTVPFDRIQALRFVEGVFREPFGYGMLYVESAGFQQKNTERSIVLAPFIKKEKLIDFFDRFIEDFEEPETKIAPPKRAFLRYLRRPNYLLLIAIPIIWWFWDLAWVLFGFLIPATFLGWLRFNDAILSIDEHTLKLQYRVLAKRTAFLKKNRAQVSELSVNPFQGYKNLATVNITAASGAGGKVFSITDLDDEEANKILKWSVHKTHED